MPGVSGISPLFAHFRPACRSLAAHDSGIDLGEEVRHQRFSFFVYDQKIESTIPPRNITVKAYSESKDDFPWHAAIVNGPFT
jgi:hypothetical protein